MLAKLQGYHQSPVHHIVAHPNKPLLLTSSSTEAILWDTEKWSRKRVLTGAKSIGVQQVRRIALVVVVWCDLKRPRSRPMEIACLPSSKMILS